MTFVNNVPMLSLSAVHGSFPFSSKYIPLVTNSKVVLGLETPGSGIPRVPSRSNGWFAANVDPHAGYSEYPGPLSVSSQHAEIWCQDGQVFLRDLDSAFGVYVNGIQIRFTTLKAGDIISLGSFIPRNNGTPAYITNDQLKPIIAKVSIVGISSKISSQTSANYNHK